MFASAVEGIDDGKRDGLVQLEVPGSAKSLAFTRGYVFALNEAGEVYQFQTEAPVEGAPGKVHPKGRKIETLSGVKQISTGEDHFVALTREGEVFTMGDDTYGQCGLGAKQRKSEPPYYERRIKAPRKVPNLTGIAKVSAGNNHTLALTGDGQLYGWGSNSKLQLSHAEDFGRVDNPLMAIFSPLRMDGPIGGNNDVTDVAAGGEFSILVTKNRANGETEVFGCGHNLNGELGAGMLRHVTDLTKIEGLSNYKVPIGNGETDVRLEQIDCGNTHCLALTSIGVVLEWGGNEFGQLGNRRRAFSEHPIIVSDFVNSRVLRVVAKHTSSGVISVNKPNPAPTQPS
eukprot:TRINITY_DN1820_c0_g1_i3.p1 TRINITY_DN1820_c0_g1~~TRINITY_DN1820_c0_g1_i3.p1  ORF type:complete len:343 (+),score=83.47 TRINITY_DN1820_c0_g1_i3:437-1465(+)